MAVVVVAVAVVVTVEVRAAVAVVGAMVAAAAALPAAQQAAMMERMAKAWHKRNRWVVGRGQRAGWVAGWLHEMPCWQARFCCCIMGL